MVTLHKSLLILALVNFCLALADWAVPRVTSVDGEAIQLPPCVNCRRSFARRHWQCGGQIAAWPKLTIRSDAQRQLAAD
jgi:hypothetical protein